MPTAEAHVETDRPGRYLTQLCRHGRRMIHLPRNHGGAHVPPQVDHAECSDAEGVITFREGRCVMRVTPGGLLLRAEASDEKNLRRIQDGIAARLERIGRRDDLTVEWRSPETPTSQPVPLARPHRRRLPTPALTVAVILLIALHLGVGGALVSDARWTGWTSILLLTIIVVLLAGKLLALRHLAAHHLATLPELAKRLRGKAR